jgi:hypothetical protein
LLEEGSAIRPPHALEQRLLGGQLVRQHRRGVRRLVRRLGVDDRDQQIDILRECGVQRLFPLAPGQIGID